MNNKRGKRILVVDNAPEMRVFLADMLRAEGYTVNMAADGQAGYDAALADHPDLIIADYSMPHKNGLELFTALRQTGNTTPFMLITAEGSEALAVQCLRMGISNYLRKPFTADDILSALDHVLARQEPTQFALARLLDDTPEAIIAATHDGSLLFCNKIARRLFGSEQADQTTGHPLYDTISNPEVLNLFAQNMPPSQHFRSELVLQDGAMIFAAQVIDAPDTGRIAILHDITARKDNERSRDEFVQRISQDIRSPLTTIMGYVELLDRVGKLNDQQRKFTNRITFSVQSITTLLSDLLKLGGVESESEGNQELTHLPLIVRYAIEGNRQQLDAKRLQLNTALTEQVPPVLGNPLHLRQLVQNLLDNAIQYTPENGQVRVVLEAEGDFLVLRIADTGVGIPSDEQARVFEKFYRGSNVRTLGGTGLGLSIVKSIVDGHNGRIWLESQPGDGTSFTIMLPAHTSRIDST